MTADDHDHDRTAAPMVDEITDFEVLEIALRELCIEKGFSPPKSIGASPNPLNTSARLLPHTWWLGHGLMPSTRGSSSPMRWPRQVLAEFGLYLPADVEIRVEDSTRSTGS